MIQAVGVVIPARDEEDLLPSCLAAVDLAARLITGTAVHLIVVADTCNDRTAALAARAGATVVEGSMANVGRARLAGAEELLRRTRALDPATVWLATTDADTLVPPCWLSRQLKHARHGWEAVVGTVTVTDWAGYSPRYQAVYTERYAAGTEAPGAETARTEIAGVEAARTEAGVEASWTEAAGVETARVETGGTARRHPHVHGANLGVTAAAYLAVGGFSALRTGEDHALVRALESAGRRVLRTTDVAVVTSARRDARAPGGFGHFLTWLEHEVMPGANRGPSRRRTR